MDRALRWVSAGLIAMFAFLTWGILVTPAGLLVKLVMFFLLSVSAFGITLIMTTESPLADAVLEAPWDEESAEGGPQPKPASDEASERPTRPRARAANRASGRAREAEKTAVAAPAGPGREADDAPAE